MFVTDSSDYHVLTEAVNMIKDVEGATFEIGLREGGGSWHIMEALVATQQNSSKMHVAIDPYGDIEYKMDPGAPYKWNPGWYTDKMRNETMSKMYAYVQEKNIKFQFFNLESTEFFARYADGIPVYDTQKQLVNKYSLVHFDGAHTFEAVLSEVMFFHPRTNPGAVFVFDDVGGWYSHDVIHQALEKLNWEKCIDSSSKWAYVKKV